MATVGNSPTYRAPVGNSAYLGSGCGTVRRVGGSGTLVEFSQALSRNRTSNAFNTAHQARSNGSAPPLPPPIKAHAGKPLPRVRKRIKPESRKCVRCSVGDSTRNMVEAARIGP